MISEPSDAHVRFTFFLRSKLPGKKPGESYHTIPVDAFFRRSEDEPLGEVDFNIHKNTIRSDLFQPTENIGYHEGASVLARHLIAQYLAVHYPDHQIVHGKPIVPSQAVEFISLGISENEPMPIQQFAARAERVYRERKTLYGRRAFELRMGPMPNPRHSKMEE